MKSRLVNFIDIVIYKFYFDDVLLEIPYWLQNSSNHKSIFRF